MSVRKSTYVFEYRITLLGAEKVGKSSLIHQFTDREFLTDYTPTAEDHLTHVVEHDENMCVCLFVDTAGSDDFPAMRKLSVTKGNAFFIVYAINDYKSFERAKLFVDEIKSLKQNGEEIKIVIVGNKSDKTDRKVSYDEGLHYTASLYEGNVTASFAETSSKDYESVTNVVHKLLTMFLPPPSQIDVPVINGRKLERRLSLARLRFRQRRTSKGIIERKSSENTKTKLKESLSDSEISKMSQSPLPLTEDKRKVRKRAESIPYVKTPYTDNYGTPPPHYTTPRFLRKNAHGSSINEISTPTLISHSMSLSRSNLLKPRPSSSVSNSSDSGVDGVDCDIQSPEELSPVSSPRMSKKIMTRRSSMPEKLQKTNFRKSSLTEKVRGIFKRTKSVCED